MLELTRGNLLTADTEALVNTVNTVGVMGKGIALQFKKAFPENFAAYAAACKRGDVNPGRMFVFEQPGPRQPRYIINFPTKRHYRDKSRLDDIAAGLNDLINVITERGIRSVAIPPLGCGLGGLSWDSVYPMIEEAASAIDDVHVLVFEPAGEPESSLMPDRTDRPRMTEGRAALLVLMDAYLSTGWEYRLSLLELQKLAYFLQESGQNLRLRFKPMWYGPYADELRHVLTRIEGHFVRGFGAASNKPQTPLEPLGDAVAEARLLLERDEALVSRLGRVRRLIDGFETPFGMELLSSVHWLAVHGIANRPATGAHEAFAQLRSWNRRKASAFSPQHVEHAWQRLASEDWVDTATAGAA